MNFSNKHIKELADNIDMECLCFLHKTNGEIESYPKDLFLEYFDDDDNPWRDVLDKIDENIEDYIKIEPMESNRSFRVMADFSEQLENEQFQEKLFRVLNKSKPFRNFNYLIHDSDYREDWFAFKESENMKWVREQIGWEINEI